MKALLLSSYRHLEVVELPTPTPGAGEVLVRVAACGICGSDIHGYDGSSGRRIPPIVMGHEAAGTVAAIGRDVKGFAEGERVTFDSTVYCGECRFCRAGQVNLCDHRQVIGVSCPDYRRTGAFAEYVVVPARILYQLPDSLSFTHAALLEAVSVALHAVALSPLQEGVSVLVVGAGMIGLLILQALKSAGCSRVVVVDMDESRLRRAAEAGAAATLLSTDTELVTKLHQFAGQAGVDMAFEAVGKDETVALAIRSVRKGGSVTLVGNISAQVTLPLQSVVTRQICIQGSCASAGEYPKAIELLSRGAIDVSPLISATGPLEDGPGWFERLYARESDLLKIVLTPGVPS